MAPAVFVTYRPGLSLAEGDDYTLQSNKTIFYKQVRGTRALFWVPHSY